MSWTITMRGMTWTADPPDYLTRVGRKQWEGGFTARTYDFAYGTKTGNPYQRRHARQCWLAGYDAAQAQEPRVPTPIE